MKKYALNPKALEDQGTLRENLMLQMKDELRPNQTKPWESPFWYVRWILPFLWMPCYPGQSNDIKQEGTAFHATRPLVF